MRASIRHQNEPPHSLYTHLDATRQRRLPILTCDKAKVRRDTQKAAHSPSLEVSMRRAKNDVAHHKSHFRRASTLWQGRIQPDRRLYSTTCHYCQVEVEYRKSSTYICRKLVANIRRVGV